MTHVLGLIFWVICKISLMFQCDFWLSIYFSLTFGSPCVELIARLISCSGVAFDSPYTWDPWWALLKPINKIHISIIQNMNLIMRHTQHKYIWRSCWCMCLHFALIYRVQKASKILLFLVIWSATITRKKSLYHDRWFP